MDHRSCVLRRWEHLIVYYAVVMLVKDTVSNTISGLVAMLGSIIYICGPFFVF